MPDPGRFDAIFVLKFFHFSSEKNLVTITLVTEIERRLAQFFDLFDCFWHYQKCRLAKACPVPCLRYFSKASALAEFSKFIATTHFQGLKLEV
jgi:hypothetical protein